MWPYLALRKLNVFHAQMSMKIVLLTNLKLLTVVTLRKHAYSNVQKILTPKNDNFQIKNSDIFHISAQNIDYGYSLEPPR